MEWAAWGLFGLLATGLLTAVLVTAQMTGRTRLDLPLLLGTFFTEDPDRARVAGFLVHLVVGQAFALGYAGVFALVGGRWWLGGVLGLVHVSIALTVLVPLLPSLHPRVASERAGPGDRALLEPPGLLALHYGAATPVVTTVAHVVYGLVLGVLFGAT